MRILYPLIYALFLTVSLPAEGQPSKQRNALLTPPEESRFAAVEALVKETVQAFNEGDRERYLALLSEDIVWMPPNEPSLHGKEAVGEWLAFGGNKIQLNITILEVGFFDEWAFLRDQWIGTVTPGEGGGPVRFDNKSVQLLHRQAGGSWKVYRAIWNSNIPLPQTEGDRM